LRDNPAKAKLRRGEPVIGAFSFLGDPAAIEILGGTGLDFVIVDTEHTPRGVESLAELVRAADAVSLPVFVRVGGLESNPILRALDMGALGIMVPHLESQDEARLAVAAVRYPPEGSRGAMSISRATGYGAVPFGEHAQRSNSEILLLALIESRAGVSNIEGIIDCGIEVIIVGRGDLSTEMGRVGQQQHPDVLAATDAVTRAVTSRGSSWLGATVGTLPEVGRWAADGCKVFIYNSDHGVLRRGFADAIPQIHSELERATAPAPSS
jgi:2-keto-3-deoxy-L-rhamnonate aldolase RhmA